MEGAEPHHVADSTERLELGQCLLRQAYRVDERESVILAEDDHRAARLKVDARVMRLVGSEDEIDVGESRLKRAVRPGWAVLERRGHETPPWVQ